MKKGELYEKLALLRDENRPTHSSCYEDVFEQLILQASKNEWPPDELPKVFTIQSISLSLDQFKVLMEQIGLNVSIEPIENSCSYGNSFQVTQKDKET